VCVCLFQVLAGGRHNSHKAVQLIQKNLASGGASGQLDGLNFDEEFIGGRGGWLVENRSRLTSALALIVV